MKTTVLLSLILSLALAISIPANIFADPDDPFDCEEMVETCIEEMPIAYYFLKGYAGGYMEGCGAAGEICEDMQQEE